MLAYLQATAGFAASFTNSASVTVSDPSGDLSWKPANRALTVSCWFKLTVPSDRVLSENMTILVNRQDGSENDQHSYLVQFNIQTGDIEFSARGDSGGFSSTLIERPYLERWYHVAIVRSGDEFAGYVDGRPLAVRAQGIGDSSSGQGLSVGGWGSGRYLFGEVQEVAVYQSALSQDFIVGNMFRDQPTDPRLTGYFKLAYSTNSTDNLRNFATGSSVPAATKVGSVEFEETDKAGEQSAFDARKNGGRDAVAPLSGAFSWQQVAFSRPTPGIAFDLRMGYASGNSFGGFKLGGSDPYAAGALGPGWRHSFETRLIPAQAFSPLADVETVGLLHWSGAIDTWDRKEAGSAEYQPRDREYKGELLSLPNGNLQWTTPERLRYLYKSPGSGVAVMRGRLLEIRDLSGNLVSLRYNEDTGILTNVVDTVRGTNILQYSAQNLLTNFTFNSWQVNFVYDSSNRLSAKWIINTAPGAAGIVAASVSNRWEFHYGTNGLLSGIVDPRGYNNLTVFYDQYGRQTNQVDALQRSSRTEYGVPGKRQIRRTDPAGFHWLESYDRKGRILTQQDPLTNLTAYAYDDRGNRTSITEPLGWKTYFGYDDRANVIAQTNALGEVTTWDFHGFFNKAIVQVTPQPADANGWTTWTNFYVIDDLTGNLLRHYDALGELVGYHYQTNGLVLASTNANGFFTSFTYDTNGFLISRTEPFTANSTVTTTYVLNDVGWKLRETNPLGDPTSYDLDLNGNPVRVHDVLGRVYHRTYDANGNLLSTTDGKGALTTFAYDAVNQRTNTTDRTRTNVWSTTYTQRGKPDRVTDPLGNTSTSTYDAANRLARVTDPLGDSVANQYDANGNSVAVFDKLGRRWSKAYDRLNRVEAEADPLGNTRRTSYDVAGRIFLTTTPNGHPTLHAYDGRGRLVLWQDAEGFKWRYTYDGVGNIIDIEDAGEPVHGHYVMTYGPRNERLTEKNQDSMEWRYEYDKLLRLKTQSDPNGIGRTNHYDPAGRIEEVRFSTDRVNRFRNYDKNDNPERVEREDATGQIIRHTFDYDLLDRMTNAVDNFTTKAIGYGYDPLGRVTTLKYPDGKTLTNHYDELGHLKRQVDWAGRELTYDYDLADRLIRRTWPNGVVQINSFDTAGRLTGLAHQASGIQNPASSNTLSLALTYAYDRNGNTTGSTEKGTLRWPQPALTDETSTFTKSGRLETRRIVPSPGGEGQGEGETPVNWTYSYDSSGNLTNAAVTGDAAATSQSWVLRYDEDNRTTSLAWTTNGVNHTVLNRYDALGRRVARTLDGVTTGYVLSLTGGMERILCDVTAAGEITAWYVHGPDLCYRVDAANEVLCYHADAQANVIALTGANGTNLLQYAYTPYGRVLGTTNHTQLSTLTSQPYRFVGSQGVMEEFPGLYFMRARYYSAEAGVFLSTDPQKNIGAGWKPIVYAYGNDNPNAYTDPRGTFAEELMESLGVEFLKDVIGASSKGTIWAFVNNHRSLAGIQGAIVGRLKQTTGGSNIKGTLTKGLGSFAIGKVMDIIEGPGVKTLPGAGFLPLPLELFFGRYQIAGETFDEDGVVYYDGKPTGDKISPQSKKQTLTVNGSTSDDTTTIAAYKGAATTETTSTKPRDVSSSSTTSSGGSSGTTTYTVKAGDTLGNIGYANGTTASKLAAANGIKNPNLIRPGQVIRIPHP